jgi:5'-nucleotidase
VDVIVSAHTHQRYAVVFQGRPVTQGYADGAAFVDIDLQIDRRTRDVRSVSWEIVTTFHDEVAPDPEVQAILDEAAQAVAPIAARELGVAAVELSKSNGSDAGETSLGNLVADAQRWRMKTDFALTSLFSIRSDLAPGPVTWGDLFAVNAYRHDVVALTLTGDQLYRLFNQQWTREADGSERYRPLQVSGLRVTWAASRPIDDRIVTLIDDAGTPIVRNRAYTVAVNVYIAGGGDGCRELLAGIPGWRGPTEVDALTAYVEQLEQPFTAAIEGRIRRLG